LALARTKVPCPTRDSIRPRVMAMVHAFEEEAVQAATAGAADPLDFSNVTDEQRAQALAALLARRSICLNLDCARVVAHSETARAD
jgi:hypothetical protein